MNKIVYMMIGVPGSGKSTLVEDSLKRICKGGVVVSSDAIREELYGDEADQGDPTVVFDLFYKRIRQYTTDEVTPYIIADATFNTAWSRKLFIRHIPENCKLVGLYINTPLHVSLSRNAQRSRCVPEDVINRMHRNLQKEPPMLEEGFYTLTKMYPELVLG